VRAPPDALPGSPGGTLTRRESAPWQGAHNNHCERSLRQIAVGGKNWLFAGSDAVARRLAILYTVVGSCELAGIRDPWEYVRDTLQKLSRRWKQSRLDELLPLTWYRARSDG